MDKDAKFEHCGKCPKFLYDQCEQEKTCVLKEQNKKTSKKGDKKPVKKGTYG